MGVSLERRRFARRCRLGWILLAISISPLATAQGTRSSVEPRPAARNLINWVHTTGDAERSFPFYRDVLGIALARSPFAVPARADAPPERIRPVSEASSDALVWDLTDTHGSRFRTVFMRAPNTPFGLELSEFFDIPRETRIANPWDPGASTLVFAVRDLDAIVRRLRAIEAPIVTLGKAPVDVPAGRSLVVRDPDGYLVQLVQAAPGEIARAAAGEIVRTELRLTVAGADAALAFYRDLLGFEVRESRVATSAELRLQGLADGGLVETTIAVPSGGVTVTLAQFEVPRTVAPAKPFRWRIQDVGAPQFQLEVAGLDALLDRTREAGYRLVSVGGKPIRRPFGRFVFAADPDGVLVEFVERAAPE
jgi:catechol 2,3-dioxygenase-like lactoylglutathione lyase family enzyme